MPVVLHLNVPCQGKILFNFLHLKGITYWLDPFQSRVLCINMLKIGQKQINYYILFGIIPSDYFFSKNKNSSYWNNLLQIF